MQALAKHGEFYKLENLHGILFESSLDHHVSIESQIFSEVENLHIEKQQRMPFETGGGKWTNTPNSDGQERTELSASFKT